MAILSGVITLEETVSVSTAQKQSPTHLYILYTWAEFKFPQHIMTCKQIKQQSHLASNPSSDWDSESELVEVLLLVLLAQSTPLLRPNSQCSTCT
jgi:hypothetical protein